MKKHTYNSEKNIGNGDVYRGSRNWLLHARYVRGEHAACLQLADDLQKQTDNGHRYAHYIKGSVLADAGRLQEALERFHSCLRLQPQDPEPLKQVAKCLYRQGRYQLSYEAYLEADKLTKQPDPDIYCALAECLSNVSGASAGVEWARAATDAGGGERAAALLARLLHRAGDTTAALHAYDIALQSSSCSAETLAAAGALRLRAGGGSAADARRAFQLLSAALALQPMQHGAALALSAMLLQHRDPDAALAKLKAALAAHPDCVAAHTNLALALLAKKKYIAALTCAMRGACGAALSATASHGAGVTLAAARRPASALCRLAAAAALAHPHPHPHTVLLIGICLERVGSGRTDAAYARACALAPDDALVTLNAAARHARCGRVRSAVEAAEHTRQLLMKAPDAQLSNALSSLLTLLGEAGGLKDLDTETAPVAEASADPEQLAPDEV